MTAVHILILNALHVIVRVCARILDNHGEHSVIPLCMVSLFFHFKVRTNIHVQLTTVAEGQKQPIAGPVLKNFSVIHFFFVFWGAAPTACCSFVCVCLCCPCRLALPPGLAWACLGVKNILFWICMIFRGLSLYFLSYLLLHTTSNLLEHSSSLSCASTVSHPPEPSGKRAMGNSKRLPTVLINHGGGPLPLLQPTSKTTMNLKDLGSKLPTPIAIIVISAHWEENKVLIRSGWTYVCSCARPRTVMHENNISSEKFILASDSHQLVP